MSKVWAAPRMSFPHRFAAVFACAALVAFLPQYALAVVTDPESGKSVEIRGVENAGLQIALETRMIEYLKSDDLSGMIDLIAIYPMEVDQARTTDEKLVYQFSVNSEGPIEFYPLTSVYQLLDFGDAELFDIALDTVPEIGELSEDGQHVTLMLHAAIRNDMDMIKALEAKCADCALSVSGYRIMNYFSGVINPYQRPNAETFRYLYQQGAVQSLYDRDVGASAVQLIAGFWVPDPQRDMDNEDYTVTEEDARLRPYRLEQKYKILKFLLDEGFDINETTSGYDRTALSNAVENNDIDMVEFLLQNGVDIDVGVNPLFIINFYTNPEIVRKLIKYGFDPLKTYPEFPDSERNRPVGSGATVYTWLARSHGFNQEMVDIFSEYDIDVNVVDGYGKTAIDYQGSRYLEDEQPFVDFLVGLGAKKGDQYYYKALVVSVEAENKSAVSDILENHPHLVNGVSDESRGLLLQKSIWMNNEQLFQFFLEKGAVIDDRADLGANLLEEALSRERYELAELILEKEISVNRDMEYRGTVKTVSRALLHAVEKGNVDWVKRLLALGASVDSLNFYDYPLTTAAYNGNVEIVSILLESGAEVNMERDGESLVDKLREDPKHQPVVDLLVKYGAK